VHRRRGPPAPLGIIDAVGTGLFRAYHNYLAVGREVQQTCFIECKARAATFSCAITLKRQLQPVSSTSAALR